MVDTIHIYLPPEHFRHLDFLTVYKQVLNSWEDPSKDDGSRYIRGYLRGLKVFASDSGIRIKGSLSKFLYNQNVSTLTRHELYLVIEELSRLLMVDIHKATVTRLHFGVTLKTRYTPLTYFKYLGTARYYTFRDRFQTTLYYSNGKRMIAIYDKVKESRKSRINIPQSYRRSHLLRIECRLEKEPSRFLKEKPLIVSFLWSNEGFRKLVEYWLNSYRQINKLQTLNMDLSAIKKPNDYKEYLALKGLEAIGGLEVALAEIEELKARNAFGHANYPSRTKAALREMAKNASPKQPNDLIEELNSKVETFAKQALKKPYLP